MAKFYNRGTAVFQKPTGNGLGFCVCVVDNGDGDEKGNTYNAEQIVRCLNQDEDIRELAAWLLKQKTLHLNQERQKLLRSIVNENHR